MPSSRNNTKISRGGQKATVPLCRAACGSPINEINRMLNRWLRVNAELRRVRQQPQSQRRESGGTIETHPFPNDMNNKQLKRISPEFLDANKHWRPQQQQQNTAINYFPNGQLPTIPRSCEEFLDPKIKEYLHSVMQQNPTQNHIYGIDFYKHYKRDKEMNIPSYYSIFEFLDPNNVEYLLKCIKADLTVKGKDTLFLLNFIKTVAKLTPTQFTAYFAILRGRGAISVDVLRYLTSLLRKTDLELHPVQMNMLLNAFNIMAEAMIRTELTRNTLKCKNEALKMKEEIMMLCSMAEPEDTAQRNEYFRKAFSMPSLRSSTGRTVITADFPVYRGAHSTGALERWNYTLPWDGYQRFFQRVLIQRMLHFHIESYPYKSRLEKYYANWKNNNKNQVDWPQLSSLTGARQAAGRDGIKCKEYNPLQVKFTSNGKSRKKDKKKKVKKEPPRWQY